MNGSLDAVAPSRDRRSSAGGALPLLLPAVEAAETSAPERHSSPPFLGTKPLLEGKLILLMCELASAHLWRRR